MERDPNKAADLRLLAAIQAFVAAHPNPDLARFRGAIADWGSDWTGVPPHHLPAAERLSDCLAHALPETHALLACFAREKASCKWERSYSKADGLVGDDMLSGYGFAEVIGARGPFLSSRVRSGIGVWGPEILYPPHRHAAEEIYVLLAGSAEFLLGEAGSETRQTRRAGEAVHVPSNRRHGFRTGQDPLAVFYIWQSGDLRQTSSFG